MAAHAHDGSPTRRAVVVSCGRGDVVVTQRGGMVEDALPVSMLLPLADADGPASRPRRATQLCLISVFRQGWITILVALLNQQ